MRQILVLLLLLATQVASSRGLYSTTDEFLAQTFAADIPAAATVWLTGEKGKAAKAILGHKPKALRSRYWQQNNRSAWVLAEIGKEQPITVGIVISDNQIESIQILEYREDRGEEVRFSSFTQQFPGLSLSNNKQLSGSIDNITGATLSVWAVSKLARLALYLHGQVNEQPTQQSQTP
jgi:hypothetical protein